MKQVSSLLLSLGCCTLSQGIFLNSVTAQVTPDGTTSTTVNVNGNDFTIEQGDRAGGNLFHSFGEFSVPTDGSAFFNNSLDIDNIFSRVTGGNISNINGLLGANGTANLYLINPMGIIFGEGARLDLGGSFFGSTADSINFSDGEFSATDLANPPLITINAPIGLSFRDNPGDIVNRSDFREINSITNFVGQLDIVDRIGLQVNPGNNITLVGGDIVLEDSGITAPGGIINLGGLSAAGEIIFNPDGSLTFPDGVTRSDLTLSREATVNVRADGGGDINVNVRNLTMSERGQLIAGIAENQGFPGAQAGDITVNATESVRIFGVNEGISFPGFESEISNFVGLPLRKRDGSDTSVNGLGNAGGIFVNTNLLEIYNEGKLSSSVFPQAEGNSGAIVVNANTILVDSAPILSIIVRETGDVGDVTLNATESIDIVNGSVILAQSIGDAVGNSGNVTINTGSFSLLGRSQIIADKRGGTGDAGNITISATESVTMARLASDTSGTLFPQIIAQLQGNTVGNAGEIVISAPTISLANFALISANAAQDAIGNPGSVTLNGDRVTITEGAIIDALTETDFTGGDININANFLELSDGGKLVAGNDANGNGGDIELNITGDIILRNGNPPGDSPFGEQILRDLASETGIFANNALESTGSGGDITITADLIRFEDRGSISTGAFSGDGGDINIDTNFIVATPNQNSDIIANSVSGDGGRININAEALFGIEERPLNDTTNDINASSEFGLDGRISIFTPDTNTLQTEINLPNSLIESEKTVAQVCQNDRSSGITSGLNIKGKGGVPSIPTNPFNSETILVDEPLTNRDIKPIQTSLGDIYPARGIVKTEDGKIILTAYATDNLNPRTPQISTNCSISSIN